MAKNKEQDQEQAPLLSVGNKYFNNISAVVYQAATPCNEDCPLYVNNEDYFNKGIDRTCPYQDASGKCLAAQKFVETKMTEFRGMIKEYDLNRKQVQEYVDIMFPLFNQLANVRKMMATLASPVVGTGANVKINPLYKHETELCEKIRKYTNEIIGEKKQKDITLNENNDILAQFENRG